MAEPISKGCIHYQNKCEVEAPCCKEWYRCHHCHNDAKDLICGLLKRSEVERIRCIECATMQVKRAKRWRLLCSKMLLVLKV